MHLSFGLNLMLTNCNFKLEGRRTQLYQFNKENNFSLKFMTTTLAAYEKKYLIRKDT